MNPENVSGLRYRELGRTGLRVSQIGLGGGGQSALGSKKGKAEAESIRVVQRAIELGINLIDTSRRNSTEGIIGQAIADYDRDSLVLSSKSVVSHGAVLVTPEQFADGLEHSLKALATPYIDIMHFHGVLPQEYDYMVAELLPVMEAFRAAGKIHHIGITEILHRDSGHQMLQRAVEDDYWDVMMVGFNMVNQSARQRVFAVALEKGIGILGMFAVRRALATVESFAPALRKLQSEGELPAQLDVDNTIEKLVREGDISRPLAGVAYRYCRDEPGIHSVLVGTGDIGHLEQNVKTFGEPPLAQDKKRFVADVFGDISNFTGN